MKIEINYRPQDNTYYAQIWDGPDAIDYRDFVCSSLGECFEQILQFRIFNSLSYAEDDPGTQMEKYFNSLNQNETP